MKIIRGPNIDRDEYAYLGLTDEEAEFERLWRTDDRMRLELLEEIMEDSE